MAGEVFSVWLIATTKDDNDVVTGRLVSNGGGGVAGRNGLDVDVSIDVGTYSGSNRCPEQSLLSEATCPGMTTDPVQTLPCQQGAPLCTTPTLP